MAEQDLRISRRTFLAGSSAGVVLAALPAGLMNGAVAAGTCGLGGRFPHSLPGTNLVEDESKVVLWG